MLSKTFKKQIVGLAATLAFAATASANVLINPSFEDDDASAGEVQCNTPGTPSAPCTGWSDFGAVFVQDSNVVLPSGPQDGSQHFKVFGTSGMFQEAAVNGGDIVNATAYAQNSSIDVMIGDQVAAVNIEWFDSAGVCTDDGGGGCVVSFGSSIGSAAPLDEWAQIGVLGAVAPASSTIARIVLITGAFAGPGGGSAFFDDASLTANPVPVPAAAWLFGSALAGLVAVRRKK